MIKTILKSACVAKPTTKHTATIIFSHGLGDSGEGWIDTMEELQSRGNGHIKFICPTAPIQTVTINNGYKMNSWYDIKSLTNRGDEIQSQVEESRTIIETIIKNEMEEHKIPSDRILIGGFSQGCALSLYTFYTQKEIKLAGCLALSGYLPLLPKFGGLMSGSINLTQPLKMIHGTDDEVVSYTWGKSSFHTLKKQNINGEFVCIEGMGHHSCPLELDIMNDFIKLTLPNQ